ncbi:MAG: hypothetical protein ACJAT1_000858 [Marivirga sp.]|jgi:hypothetical protein
MNIHLLKWGVLVSLLFALCFSACNNDGSDNGQSTFAEMSKQKARGENGEIILVISPDLWDSEVGEQIRSLFNQPVKGLPQDEPKYSVKKTDPSKFNSVLKASKNLLFVAALSDKTQEGLYMKKYFTDNSLKQIADNPKLFSFNQEDVYATGQEVLYLFGRTDAELAANLARHKNQVSEFFNAKEQERLLADLKKSVSSGIMKYVSDTLGVDLVVPFGYDIARKEDNFIWFRKLDQREELNFWLVKMPYDDEGVFDVDKFKSFRNELGRKYITDIDNDSLYLTTQDELPLLIDTVNLNGNYALEARGLWKYSNNSRGGAFVSYLFANEQDGLLYYLEGYLDNPGKDKREPIRLIETILGTADVPDALKD